MGAGTQHRPFKDAPLESLDREAQRSWSDLTLLKAISSELEHRTGTETGKLRLRLETQIRSMENRLSACRPSPYEAELNQLRAEKAAAESRVRALESELAAVQIRLAEIETILNSEAREHEGLFGRVGLSPNAPGFVIEAARKAYRKNLHPDIRPEHQREEAEERFKLAECIFDQIEILRAQ